MTSTNTRLLALSTLPLLLSGFMPIALAQSGTVSTAVNSGQSSFHDWTQEKPGVRWKTLVTDLPAPNEPESVDNGPTLVPRPKDAWPQAPAGFKVELYQDGVFKQPRLLRTAPNGDLFIADSQAGSIIVLRGVTSDGKAATKETFATGLDHPFGISFYPSGSNPQWVYVANTTSLVRFPYKNGDMKASGKPQTIVPTLPGYAQLRGGGHWTRDVVFSQDGSKMLVSVGSASNADDPDTHPKEFHRADVLEFTPEGKFIKVYASGIRNCVGEAINPITGQLWCSTNERDRLGDNLVPDYITSVNEDGFYGWPWYYIGNHQDPRLPQPCANGTGPNLQAAALTDDQAKNCKRVDLSSKVIVPDVLLQSHFASLEMLFYDGKQFPSGYTGDAFAAEHGSWNRAHRAGYEVIRVPMKDGHATGAYEDFLTGFVNADGTVWGRPVGVTVGNDGSLFVTDDGTKSVWHVIYTGK